MLFNSLEFLIFFPLVAVAYFVCQHRYRWIVLLLASCIFYASSVPAHLLLLLTAIFVNYFAAIWIEGASGHKKTTIFVGSLCFSLSLLFVFKYFNFFGESVNALARLLHWNYSVAALHILLPLGISFYTFQIISYVIEVFRGNQKAERDLGMFATYIMFFPQLIAGPIARPQLLLHQFYEKHSFEYKRAADGLKLMAWGMFKKVVVADRLAMYVNEVYNHPTEYQGITFLIATFFFAFQILCDFSGYSDMAVGAAQVIGFRLAENFRQPFFAKSIADFWTRWHITLSNWLKDYLYTPLSISLRDWGQWGISISLIITFVICGLWHGATANFVIFGFLHGLALSLEMVTKKSWKRIWQRFPKLLENIVGVAGTFLFVCFSLIFFRADKLPDALYISTHLFSGLPELFLNALSNPSGEVFKNIIRQMVLLGDTKESLLTSTLLIGILLAVHVMQTRCVVRDWLSRQHWGFRWALYYTGLIIMLNFGIYYGEQFIYFKF